MDLAAKFKEDITELGVKLREWSKEKKSIIHKGRFRIGQRGDWKDKLKFNFRGQLTKPFRKPTYH